MIHYVPAQHVLENLQAQCFTLCPMYLQAVLQLSRLVITFIGRWHHHMGIVYHNYLDGEKDVRDYNLNFKTPLKQLMNSTDGMCVLAHMHKSQQK
jgi:hypothetical protein